MNVKELIGKYEYMSHACFRRVDTLEVLKDLRQLDEPQKVTVPQFVAGWIEEARKSCKDVADFFDFDFTNEEVGKWFMQERPFDLAARAWLDGYEVEEEPKYIVKIKSTKCSTISLVFSESTDVWLFSATIYQGLRFKHTRKQLEDAGFGWVFDCEGIEVREMEE